MRSNDAERYFDPSQKSRLVGGEMPGGLLSSYFHSSCARPDAIIFAVRQIVMEPMLATALRSLEQRVGCGRASGAFRGGQAGGGRGAGGAQNVSGSFVLSLVAQEAAEL